MNRPDVPPPAELFLGFAKASISGFGGVLPFARHMLVDDKKWLSEQEFADLFSFSQFMPGANVVNLSVCVGSRFHGPLGGALGLGAAGLDDRHSARAQQLCGCREHRRL